MICNIYTKKVNDLYSNYFEDSLLFETSQDYFNYLVQNLKQLKEFGYYIENKRENVDMS